MATEKRIITHTRLCKEIAKTSSYKEYEIDDMLNLLVEAISTFTSQEKEVRIKRLGSFLTKKTKEKRTVSNLNSRPVEIIIAPKNVIKFRPSDYLSERIK